MAVAGRAGKSRDPRTLPSSLFPARFALSVTHGSASSLCSAEDEGAQIAHHVRRDLVPAIEGVPLDAEPCRSSMPLAFSAAMNGSI